MMPATKREALEALQPPTLAEASLERLFWIALAGINQGVTEEVVPVLAVLAADSRSVVVARALSAYRIWRIDKGRGGVEELVRLARGNAVAGALLGYVQLESGLVESALEQAKALLSVDDARARFLAVRLVEHARQGRIEQPKRWFRAFEDRTTALVRQATSGPRAAGWYEPQSLLDGVRA